MYLLNSFFNIKKYWLVTYLYEGLSSYKASSDGTY